MFGASMFVSFGSKYTALKKVLAALLGFFGASRSHSATTAVIQCPHSDSTSGELRPLAPLVTPLVVVHAFA